MSSTAATRSGPVRSEDVITGLDSRGFPGAIVMFGLGCSADFLQSASWLAAAQIHYRGVRAPPLMTITVAGPRRSPIRASRSSRRR
jgi:hypothetical protein